MPATLKARLGAALTSAILFVAGVPVLAQPEAPAVSPWVGDRLPGPTDDADPRGSYFWPPVSDDYLRTAPLKDIDKWLHRCWTQHASDTRPRLAGSGDDVVNVTPLAEPLTPGQWDLLAQRTATTLERRENEGGLPDLLHTMADTPIVLPDPAPGFRALADQTWQRLTVSDEVIDRSLPFLAATFAARTGDITFARRVLERLDSNPKPLARVRLLEALNCAVFDAHDLSESERVVAASKLLSSVESEPFDRLTQARTISSALRLCTTQNGRLAVIERAAASPVALVRAMAASRVGQLARRNPDEPDAPPPPLDRLEPVALRLLDDADAQTATNAVSSLLIIAENDLAAWLRNLERALQTPHPSAAALACSLLPEHPDACAHLIPRLTELAASPDRDLAVEARNAINAIKAAQSGD